ncbi:hypothetical protein EDB81DRAFT_671193, partial [Dactylonectria macrodidyma]
NCKCAPWGEKRHWSVITGCIQIGNDIRAVSVNGPAHQITCSIFTDENCQNEVQSLGQKQPFAYACTAFNQESGSIKCYYNVKS